MVIAELAMRGDGVAKTFFTVMVISMIFESKKENSTVNVKYVAQSVCYRIFF